jgi:hypothetical protein
VGVPCPSDLQANRTTECAANCVQGNGTEEETASYAACQSSCISSLFFPLSTTAGAAGATGTGAGGSEATTTGADGTGIGKFCILSVVCLWLISLQVVPQLLSLALPPAPPPRLPRIAAPCATLLQVLASWAWSSPD